MCFFSKMILIIAVATITEIILVFDELSTAICARFTERGKPTEWAWLQVHLTYG